MYQIIVMQVAVKITNDIIEGNGVWTQRRFCDFSTKVDATSGDLLFHTDVLWLCVVNCLQQLLSLHKEIPISLKNEVKSYNTEMENGTIFNRNNISRIEFEEIR